MPGRPAAGPSDAGACRQVGGRPRRDLQTSFPTSPGSEENSLELAAQSGRRALHHLATSDDEAAERCSTELRRQSATRYTIRRADCCEVCTSPSRVSTVREVTSSLRSSARSRSGARIPRQVAIKAFELEMTPRQLRLFTQFPPELLLHKQHVADVAQHLFVACP